MLVIMAKSYLLNCYKQNSRRLSIKLAKNMSSYIVVMNIGVEAEQHRTFSPKNAVYVLCAVNL